MLLAMLADSECRYFLADEPSARCPELNRRACHRSLSRTDRLMVLELVLEMTQEAVVGHQHQLPQTVASSLKAGSRMTRWLLTTGGWRAEGLL